MILREKFIVIGLIFLAFALLSYKITEVPPGINSDEASIGYNASLLARTGHDENGRLLPIFVLTFGGDWKQPITMYSTAFIFKAIGVSYEALRLTSVLFVLISVAIIFYLAKEIWNTRFAILASILFITTPIVIIQSHLALENVALVPFILIWLWGLYRYDRTKLLTYLLVSGISLGLSFYSYKGMRLVVPVLYLLSLFYLLVNERNWDRFLRPALRYSLAIAPFIIALVLLKDSYPGAIFGSDRPQNIQSYQQFLLPVLSSFDLSFLYLKGDSTPYHSTGKHGMLMLITLPFFLVGTYQAIRQRNTYLLFLLSIIFLSPILYGLVGSVYRASRLMVILPSYILIATFGLAFFWSTLRENRKKIVIIVLALLFILNLGDFLIDYWGQYSDRAREHFPSIAHLAYKHLYKQSKELNVTPYIQGGIQGKEGVASQFFEQSYFPKGVRVWKLEDRPPESAIILSYDSDFPVLEKSGYSRLNIDMPFYVLSLKNNE